MHWQSPATNISFPEWSMKEWMAKPPPQSCHIHQHFEQTLDLTSTCYMSVSFAQHGRTFLLQEEYTWPSPQKLGTVWISHPCNNTRTKKKKQTRKTPHHTTEISFAEEVQNTGPAADSACVLHSSYLCRREAPHWGRKICEWKKEPPNPDGQFKMLAEPQHSALPQSLTAAVTPGHFRPEPETALKHCQGITAPQN